MKLLTAKGAAAEEIPRGGAVSPLDQSTPELEVFATLGDDHVAWAQDHVVLSAQALSWLGQIKAVIVPWFGFWDHIVRVVQTEEGILKIDPSGSYGFDFCSN